MSESVRIRLGYNCRCLFLFHLRSLPLRESTFCAEQNISEGGRFMYRWDQVCSPVHAVAFKCDHFYKMIRVNVGAAVSEEFMELRKGNLHVNATKL